MRILIIKSLEKNLQYLEPLLPTANCHMVDFFVNNIYENHIPIKLRQEISNIDSNELIDILNQPREGFPELNKFIESSKEHTLLQSKVCLSLYNLEQKLINFGCKNLSGFHLESFMTSKKSHEVEIMSKIASAMNEISRTTHIIDIGDGKGYLSSALAMHDNLKVLGIDSSVINTIGAAKRITKLNRAFKRTESKMCDNDLYKQTTQFVTETTDLNKLVNDHFSSSMSCKIGLVGLHTCGDLATSCIKIFKNNPDIETLFNVGCCYHLITETENFPLSCYLKKRNFKLGRNARMIAAQSLERMLHNREQPSDTLFYRSLLQVYLSKNAPHLLDLQAGRFKKPTTFCEYVYKTLKKFNSELVPTKDELLELYNCYLPKMKELQMFYILRAHLAPVIEAVILLDRLLFLYECGIQNLYLVQLFDPVISPRCYGIIAFKSLQERVESNILCV